MVDQPEAAPIQTINDHALHLGQNLPNHSTSLAGRGKYIAQGVALPPLWRTRQDAYRYAAWLITMAEALPNEDDCEAHTFEVVLDAVRNT